MTNPKIEINNVEEAKKWIGREVRFGPFSLETPSGILHLDEFERLAVGLGRRALPATIELLDGPAHPCPDGAGWIWCQTADDAKRFVGERVEYDAPAAEHGISATRGFGAVSDVTSRNVNISDYKFSMPLRGGMWIRRTQTDRSERESPISKLKLELEAAESQIAEAVKRRDYLKSRLEHESFPLPLGWRWVGPEGLDSPTLKGYLEDEIEAKATDGTFVVFVTVSGELAMLDLDDESWAHAPFGVVSAVIARYESEADV